ncbi:hypothetical protein HPB47_020571 [Ixodes persulcatus]|uniref:Uncharacterized protein n=1 Tax=Ixodes persulcatus TaxID=34615 RepID=A0AC60QFS6_IXOPE|nr:hypothetical protein HPB47_020571 [Ixodes persulcatus]
MNGCILEKDFLVEKVLAYLDTEELFTCCEVNKLWQGVALSLLRKKLISVSVCCAPDSERVPAASSLDNLHVCVDIFCAKFCRYRNLARMAGMRPTLVFLSHHADLNEDKRDRLPHAPSVVESLRDLLPVDSVIIYFKLELIRPLDCTEDVTHEGIFGEFLFRADAAPEALRSDEAARQFPASTDGGAVFHNVLPGVLMFQALHVTEAGLEGHAVTSYFTEASTKRTIQASAPDESIPAVTSAALFCTMHSARLLPFMRALRDSFGTTANTIAVAFPRNQDEALPELEAFERFFPDVPALANQATEFNVDGQYAPLGRLKLILLLIKLLE